MRSAAVQMIDTRLDLTFDLWTLYGVLCTTYHEMWQKKEERRMDHCLYHNVES